MKQRVLIIGPHYYNFLPAVSNAFQELGWQTDVVGYDTPVHPYTTWMKCKYKLCRDKERIRKKSREKFSKFIKQRFTEYQPDVVFIMNGDILEPPTLDFFRQSAKVALWFFDNRKAIPISIGHVDHVNALFCFDRDDVDWYADQGKKAFFLPQACDPAIYRPLNLEKKIDILFIGNLFYSPKRKALMNAVIDRFPEQKIVVYGWYQPWFKGVWKWLTRPHKDIYKNVNVTSEQANVLYNRTRIALNIHQERQTNGANPRIFEICGTGAYQVCDRNPYVESLFPDGSVGFYGNKEELFALLSDALANDKFELAQRAMQTVLCDHTFKNRIETVLSVLGCR